MTAAAPSSPAATAAAPPAPGATAAAPSAPGATAAAPSAPAATPTVRPATAADLGLDELELVEVEETMPSGPIDLTAATGGEGKDWDYSAETGPATWGKTYPRCGKGKFQAPIELFGFTMVNDLKLEFSYNRADISLAVTPRAVDANFEAPGKGGFITLSGKRYELIHFHFHTPAEHTLRGESYEMEAHLVHRSSDGEIAIVAVLFEGEGQHNAALAPLLPLPTATTIQFDPSELLPLYRSFFKYTGSLTTPPCSEGVTWLVLTNTMYVSPEQFVSIRKLFPMGNARPLQKYRPTLHLGNGARWE